MLRRSPAAVRIVLVHRDPRAAQQQKVGTQGGAHPVRMQGKFCFQSLLPGGALEAGHGRPARLTAERRVTTVCTSGAAAS